MHDKQTAIWLNKPKFQELCHIEFLCMRDTCIPSEEDRQTLRGVIWAERRIALSRTVRQNDASRFMAGLKADMPYQPTVSLNGFWE